jgi:hypothetical protein
MVRVKFHSCNSKDGQQPKDVAMTTQGYRQAGFDVYTFTNPASRTRYLTENLGASGIEFETHEVEEVVAHFTLYQLAVKRITPTLKQQLKKHLGDK